MNSSASKAKTVLVDIRISEDDYLMHYQGSVSQVSAIAHDGRRIQFPSKILQPFVLHNGIQGTFAIHFDEQHKFVSIERVN